MTKAIGSGRINSIDILRGIVMVIMALDHVREFFNIDALTKDPLDIENGTAVMFFTRWITHYCAPTFVFLSGISAGLSASKKSLKEGSAFMIRRGVWLIFAEITIITFALTYNPFYHFIIFQVIWVIGWGLVLLGLVRLLSQKAVLFIGLIIVLGHNLLDYVHLPEGSAKQAVINIFFQSRGFTIPFSDERLLVFLYAIIPWAGIMMIGYGIYPWFLNYSQAQRKKMLMVAGLSSIFLFLAIRFVNLYGDPLPWLPQKTGFQTFLSFLNTTKYPPSLLYTAMTIGPALLALAFLEKSTNRLANLCMVYGKVPFFYYVLHFYTIHTLSVALFFISGYGSKDIISADSPFWFRPPTFGYSLPLTYLIWLAIVAGLYVPCIRFAAYKRAHSDKWWVHYL
ncbi:hypothetical protein DYBT9275_04078 [Dyadobacter sp. CECT 9275]|uniref:Heparan-alpha-glucosaminide N-acetyltransferase catalytic domain-containing protein n=1 Tax=Dyadobacter helix TaxID=2822344 RepID=A0A916N795_9BACT|nr:heparan-alpha-glucosaminide N-acetyltransferase domain-containing protein [Dyadobacter sp. CECT 9275]CAG5007571.1 hypothetical protein DYBT9275_04078 [Dyadobacter sp. CECT 9275]